jgi:hypothetical protein
MLELLALLRAAGIAVSGEDRAVKVHLAVKNDYGDDPLDVFHEGDFPSWQQEQTAKNFECDQVIALISLGDQRWLFAGVYTSRSRKAHPSKRGRFLYDLQELPGQEELIGRIVLRWNRNRARSSYRWLDSMGPIVVESYSIAEIPFKEFPGWDQPWSLRWNDLQAIDTNGIAAWTEPLSNVNGIYLITDQCDLACRGQQYVGIASGGRGIWGRWATYAQTGHGGNKKLRALLRARGSEHAKNFLYTILETAPVTATVPYLATREQHWMFVLGSKVNGLNS